MALDRRRKLFILGAVGIGAAGLVLVWGPIPQPQRYHEFADARGMGPIPNFLNVLSNLPFLLVGISGLAFLAGPRARAKFLDPRERVPWAVLLGSVSLISLGSTAYHWRPSDATLLWDRLPMALLFGSFLSVTVIDRLSVSWGSRLLLPLLLAAVGSVLYWHFTNGQGRGDLRFYILIQGAAMGLVPLVVILFPSRYTGTREIVAVLLLYGLAKGFEGLDGPMFRLGQVLSGHTLKHLLSALAAWRLLCMLRDRRPLAAAGSAASENLVALPSPD